MEKIIIVGAGGFGREVKMLIDQINHNHKKYELIGFVDDSLKKGTIINGIEVIGSTEELNLINFHVNLVIAIGNPLVKKKIIESINSDFFDFPTLIHPSVFIGNDNVYIGKGCIICAGCLITVNIEIQDFIILNLMCTVGHDTKIGSYSSFMPSVNISGDVEINDCVYVGTGAKIINQLTIGESAIIGAGAVVIKSIPANCTALGMPARPIKIN